MNPGPEDVVHLIPIRAPPTPDLSPRLKQIEAELEKFQLGSSPLLSLQDRTPRRQFLDRVVDSCTHEELHYLWERVSPMMKCDFFSNLPTELALLVLSFVDEPIALTRLERVNTRYSALARDEGIWERLCGCYGYGEEFDEEARPTSGLIFAKPFSYRERFRRAYTVATKWRKGGDLLRSHKNPILSPDSGTLTSLAMDDDWIVVGRSNSAVNVYSAKTGVLARTLKGHQSGVWSVCLISRSAKTIDSTQPRPSPSSTNSARSSEGNLRRLPPPESISRHVSDSPRGRSSLSPLPPIRRAESTNSRSSTPSDDTTFIPGNEDYPHDYLLRKDLRFAIGLDPPLRVRTDPGSPEPTLGTFSGHGQHWNTSASQGWGQPHSIIVSTGCDKIVRVWDGETGNCIYALKGHTATIRCLRVLESRPLAVTGSRDDTLRVWDIQRGYCRLTLAGHTSSIRCLDVDRTGRRVVSGSYDSTCRIWDIESGQCLHILQGHFHQVYCVEFSPFSDNLLASSGLDTTVRLWDTESGTCVALLQAHSNLVSSLQFTPNLLFTGAADGRILTFSLGVYSADTPLQPTTAKVADPSIRSNANSGDFQVVHRLAAHDSFITSLQADEKRGRLVTAGNDGRVKLFDFTTSRGMSDGGNGSAPSRLTEEMRYVRDLSEPGDNVWKVGFLQDTYAVLCKKGKKTVVEIWGVRP